MVSEIPENALDLSQNKILRSPKTVAVLNNVNGIMTFCKTVLVAFVGVVDKKN